jgi:GNAT acetyltransferase-like protein
VAFLPADYVVPTLVAGPRFRIRPITVHDVVKVYDAVMTSQEQLWALFGAARGWPSASLTLEQCLIDMAWQQKEAELRRSFAFAVVSTDESRLLGSVVVSPPGRAGADAEVTFWVRACEESPGLADEIEEFVREWVISAWPFKEVRFPGRDIPWDDWSALSALPVIRP